MRPILFHITQHFYMRSEHLMLFIGGLAAIIVILWEMRRLRESPAKVYPLLLFLLFGSVYGARILFWVNFRERYGLMPCDLLVFWQGGMSFYGGAILALCLFIAYTNWQKMAFWKIADMIAPAAAIFIFFARIGCFLIGDCYGSRCSHAFPFAVVFRDPSAIAPKNIPLYPTQLFFSISGLLIFLILIVRRKHKRFEGELSIIGVFIFSLTSFVIEFFRGDQLFFYEVGGRTLSQNQIISAIAFCSSILLYLHRRRRI